MQLIYDILQAIMDAKDLSIVRFTQPAMVSIIPPVLFEQLVEVDEGVRLNALIKTAADNMACPQVYFFAFIDPKINQVVGFLWCVHSLLKNRLIVSYTSFKSEYQHIGIVKRFFEVWKGVVDRLKLDPTVELYILYPRIAERYGGTPSKTRIFEFDTTAPDYGQPRRKDGNDVAEIEIT